MQTVENRVTDFIGIGLGDPQHIPAHQTVRIENSFNRSVSVNISIDFGSNGNVLPALIFAGTVVFLMVVGAPYFGALGAFVAHWLL